MSSPESRKELEPSGSNAVSNKGQKRLGRAALLVLSGALVAGVPSGLYIDHEFTGSHTISAVSGVLHCPEGEPVVGAWIEPSDHRDRGWVAWQATPGHPNTATFTAGLPHSDSDSYNLGVGCAGNSYRWEHNDQTPEIKVSPEFVQVDCTDQEGIKGGTCVVGALALANVDS